MGRANQGKSKPYGGNPPPNAALTLKGFSAPWQTIRHLLRAASADRPIVGTNKRTLANPSNPLMIFCTRIRETDQIFAQVENKPPTGERHDVQARGFRQPPRQQAPHASPAQSGVHASAAATFPPARQEGN